MSILIKGMEMPTNCDDCLLGCDCPYDQSIDGYKMQGGRPRTCPIIPVPPHELIAREQILDAIRLELEQANACNDMDDYDAWMRVFDYVRKFPTIIPQRRASDGEG